LAQLREDFRALAAGDPRTALRAARQLTDETERETALLALVTEWKQGELSPPRQRAWAIASLGLEAGLGLELAQNLELAQLWASELTDGQSRAVAPEHLGAAMVDADPAAAFAFSEQLSAADRRKFLDAAFASWARKDTDAALKWVDQFSDAAERDAAMKTIRSVAPVGIGVELGLKEGYPVINRLFAGSPAELSGQFQPGDRIVAVAQGDNAFVDTRSLAMQDLVQSIRGAPGTLIQLQVLPADAPAGSFPKTVTLLRDQLKLKR
jgi:predicted metalloprotease with PDZ domain